MTNQDIFRELTYIDPASIAATAPRDGTQRKKQSRRWLKWGAVAAAVCVVATLAFRAGIALTPSQMTDVFREGIGMELTSLDQLPAQYPGDLLVENLPLKPGAVYEFYYKEEGDPTDTDDWYSLLLSEGYGEGEILLHCMFGDPDIEDWKVDMVFTKEATETRVIHGVEVQIARQQPSLRAEYWYYAIFKYDGVVYDLRTLSDDAGYVDEVLERMLGELD